MVYNINYIKGRNIISFKNESVHICDSCRKVFDVDSEDIYFSEAMRALYCKKCLHDPKVSTIFPGFRDHSFYICRFDKDNF